MTSTSRVDDRRFADVPVVGVDWYKGGWVGAALGHDEHPLLMVGADLAELIGRVPDARCVAVDMPIGLPSTVRDCDVQAKRFVRPRHNSVFMTPPQSVLYAPTYEEANRVALELLGKKISKQAYALGANVRKVSALSERDPRIIEVHPEVSFKALVGEPVAWPKNSWNGQAIRRLALQRAAITLPNQLDEAGGVPVADVLDALVAGWSARRYATGHADSLPTNAVPGAREVIWY